MSASPVSLRNLVRSTNTKVLEMIDYALEVAPTPYAVLIEGETGTGKELFARGIHTASGRPGPFVPLNCSALPDTMFEAELFGARRGAYTGLDVERQGLLRVAHRGTLFLDEVADLPHAMQAKLLRVLEDGEVRPLGGTDTIQVDVRVVSATHKSLTPLARTGQFRRDLFFRLSAACIKLPNLRERRDDVPVLVQEALDEACRLQGVPLRTLAADALAALASYPWPGNIRELKNVVAAAVLNSRADVVTAADLPSRAPDAAAPGPTHIEVPSELAFFDALESFERDYMAALLRRSGGNISSAARLSGLSRSTVRAKARAHGLVEDPGDSNSGKRSRARKAP